MARFCLLLTRSSSAGILVLHTFWFYHSLQGDRGCPLCFFFFLDITFWAHLLLGKYLPARIRNHLCVLPGHPRYRQCHLVRLCQKFKISCSDRMSMQAKRVSVASGLCFVLFCFLKSVKWTVSSDLEFSGEVSVSSSFALRLSTAQAHVLLDVRGEVWPTACMGKVWVSISVSEPFFQSIQSFSAGLCSEALDTGSLWERAKRFECSWKSLSCFLYWREEFFIGEVKI